MGLRKILRNEVIIIKKRAMKKWIPKETIYCNECKWRHHIKTIKLNETNCKFTEACTDKPCWTKPNNSCKVRIYKCDYLGYIDWEEESLLFDGVKECRISEEYN